jgi:hypothetical protein
MAKFITKTSQAHLFQAIVKLSIEHGDSDPALFGKIVNNMLNRVNVKQSWIKYSSDLSPGEKEIIQALKKNFAILRVDGVYYYNEYNIATTGPFDLVRDPRCHVLSTKCLNKLKEKGLITILYGYGDQDNCVQIVRGV